MSGADLFAADGPAVSVLELAPALLPGLAVQARAAHPDWAVVRLRGTKALDRDRFFDEAAAAWQFPAYFGENWDACWDCLTDLAWAPRPGYLQLVEDADHLLPDSVQDFDTLVTVLRDAHEHWRRQPRPDVAGSGAAPGPGVSFRTLLVCRPGRSGALTARLNRAGGSPPPARAPRA